MAGELFERELVPATKKLAMHSARIIAFSLLPPLLSAGAGRPRTENPYETET